MMKKSGFLALAFAFSVGFTGANSCHATTAEISKAAVTDDSGLDCRDAGVFSTKLITGVCWECMFPIKVSGIVISGTKNKGRIPEGASDTKGLCVCFDNLGMPQPGVPSAFWEPYRLAEFVRTPGCSQVLLGKRFPFDRLNRGESNPNTVNKQRNGVSGSAFRHYHFYSFPVASMLSMYMPEKCNPGYFNDLDIMYLSEVDPTWNNDDLAFFANPESALFANPIAPLTCIPDAFATLVDSQLENLWWCAGSWGMIHSPSGNVSSGTTTLNSTSLQMARMLYVMHKRGFEFGTVGDTNACGGGVSVTLPKEQYRFSMFYPVAETDDNHILGRSELFWGSAKLIPGLSSDPVYIVWRWLDCCNY